MKSLVEKYFEINDIQAEQFTRLKGIYTEWNAKINVISRKDIEEFDTHHLLHSLSIGAVCKFEAGARVLDIGTGGGFPTIPLAILFPDVQFVAVDSIGKKIKVLSGVIEELGLKNVTPINDRVENVKQRFDYAITRAVAPMGDILRWSSAKIERGKKGSLENGIFALKGGELAEELALCGRKFDIYSIPDLFEESYFETKKIVYAKK